MPLRTIDSSLQQPPTGHSAEISLDRQQSKRTKHHRSEKPPPRTKSRRPSAKGHIYGLSRVNTESESEKPSPHTSNHA